MMHSEKSELKPEKDNEDTDTIPPLPDLPEKAPSSKKTEELLPFLQHLLTGFYSEEKSKNNQIYQKKRKKLLILEKSLQTFRGGETGVAEKDATAKAINVLSNLQIGEHAYLKVGDINITEMSINYQIIKSPEKESGSHVTIIYEQNNYGINLTPEHTSTKKSKTEKIATIKKDQKAFNPEEARTESFLKIAFDTIQDESVKEDRRIDALENILKPSLQIDAANIKKLHRILINNLIFLEDVPSNIISASKRLYAGGLGHAVFRERKFFEKTRQALCQYLKDEDIKVKEAAFKSLQKLECALDHDVIDTIITCLEHKNIFLEQHEILLKFIFQLWETSIQQKKQEIIHKLNHRLFQIIKQPGNEDPYQISIQSHLLEGLFVIFQKSPELLSLQNVLLEESLPHLIFLIKDKLDDINSKIHECTLKLARLFYVINKPLFIEYFIHAAKRYVSIEQNISEREIHLAIEAIQELSGLIDKKETIPRHLETEFFTTIIKSVTHNVSDIRKALFQFLKNREFVLKNRKVKETLYEAINQPISIEASIETLKFLIERPYRKLTKQLRKALLLLLEHSENNEQCKLARQLLYSFDQAKQAVIQWEIKKIQNIERQSQMFSEFLKRSIDDGLVNINELLSVIKSINEHVNDIRDSSDKLVKATAQVKAINVSKDTTKDLFKQENQHASQYRLLGYDVDKICSMYNELLQHESEEIFLAHLKQILFKIVEHFHDAKIIRIDDVAALSILGKCHDTELHQRLFNVFLYHLMRNTFLSSLLLRAITSFIENISIIKQERIPSDKITILINILISRLKYFYAEETYHDKLQELLPSIWCLFQELVLQYGGEGLFANKQYSTQGNIEETLQINLFDLESTRAYKRAINHSLNILCSQEPDKSSQILYGASLRRFFSKISNNDRLKQDFDEIKKTIQHDINKYYQLPSPELHDFAIKYIQEKESTAYDTYSKVFFNDALNKKKVLIVIHQGLYYFFYYKDERAELSGYKLPDRKVSENPLKKIKDIIDNKVKNSTVEKARDNIYISLSDEEKQTIKTILNEQFFNIVPKAGLDTKNQTWPYQLLFFLRIALWNVPTFEVQCITFLHFLSKISIFSAVHQKEHERGLVFLVIRELLFLLDAGDYKIRLFILLLLISFVEEKHDVLGFKITFDIFSPEFNKEILKILCQQKEKLQITIEQRPADYLLLIELNLTNLTITHLTKQQKSHANFTSESAADVPKEHSEKESLFVKYVNYLPSEAFLLGPEENTTDKHALKKLYYANYHPPRGIGSAFFLEAYKKYFPLEYRIDAMWHKTQQHFKEIETQTSSFSYYVSLEYVKTEEQLDIADAKRKKLQQKIDNWIESSLENKIMLIQGRMGSGKSLFGLWLNRERWKLYKPGEGKESWIPLLINLKQLKDPTQNCIAQALKEWDFEDEEIELLKHSNKKLLLFFDGFDELRTPINLYRGNQIETWKNVKIIITCRMGFLHGNYKSYFGIEPGEVLFIAPFSLEQRKILSKKIREKMALLAVTTPTNDLSLPIQQTDNKKTIKRITFIEFKKQSFIQSPNRQILDENLLINGLRKGIATTKNNNCLLDSYFQNIQVFLILKNYPINLESDNFQDFVDFVRKEIGKEKSEMLSANDENEGVEILKAIQQYLYEKFKIMFGFKLQICFADKEENLGIVDNVEEIEQQIHCPEIVTENIIPLRIIQVNYNHYDPVFLTSENALTHQGSNTPAQVTLRSFHDGKKKDVKKQISPVDKFLKDLDIDDQLKESPFIIKLLVELYDELQVTQLQKENYLNQAFIFKAFTERWHRNKAKELNDSGKLPTGAIVDSEKIARYAMDLAFAMFLDDDRAIIRVPPPGYRMKYEAEQDKWGWFLPEKDAHTHAALSGAPVLYNGRTIQFIHKSVQDYYVALGLFQEIGFDKSINEAYLFGKKHLSIEHEIILNFLKELIFNDKEHRPQYIDALFKMVEHSREMPSYAVVSANAATLLAFMGVPFSGKDLSNIRIPKADLTGACLDATILKGADLSGTCLQDVWLRSADLTSALLKGTNFHQPPFLKHRDNISSCLRFCHYQDKEQRYLATAKRNLVYIWDCETGRRHRTINSSVHDILEMAFSKDNQSLLYVSEKEISYFDIKSKRTWGPFSVSELIERSGDQTKIKQAKFSLDTTWLALQLDESPHLLWVSHNVWGFKDKPIFQSVIVFDIPGTEITSFQFNPVNTTSLHTTIVARSTDERVLIKLTDSKEERYVINPLKRSQTDQISLAWQAETIKESFLPNGEFCLFQINKEDNKLEVYNVFENEHLESYGSNLKLGTIKTLTIDYTANKIALADAHGTVIIWSIEKKDKEELLFKEFTQIDAMAFKQSGDLLALASGRMVGLKSTQRRYSLLRNVNKPISKIAGLAFNSEDELLAYSEDGVFFQSWDVTYGIQTTNKRIDRKHFTSMSSEQQKIMKKGTIQHHDTIKKQVVILEESLGKQIILSYAEYTDDSAASIPKSDITQTQNIHVSAKAELTDSRLKNKKTNNLFDELFTVKHYQFSADRKIIACVCDTALYVWQLQDEKENSVTFIAKLSTSAIGEIQLAFFEHKDKDKEFIATSNEKGIIQLWKRIKGLSWSLWATTESQLRAEEAIITRAIGLREANYTLLDQLHAKGQPLFDQGDAQDYSPLHLAVLNGDIDKVKTLFAKGEGQEYLDSNEGPKQSTPLHLAVENNNLDIVKYLLDKQANFCAIDSDERTPGLCAKEREDDRADILEILPWTDPDKLNSGFFLTAIREHKLQILNLLLRAHHWKKPWIDEFKRKENINGSIDDNGISKPLLYIAVEEGFIEGIHVLLDASVDPTILAVKKKKKRVDFSVRKYESITSGSVLEKQPIHLEDSIGTLLLKPTSTLVDDLNITKEDPKHKIGVYQQTPSMDNMPPGQAISIDEDKKNKITNYEIQRSVLYQAIKKGWVTKDIKEMPIVSFGKQEDMDFEAWLNQIKQQYKDKVSTILLLLFDHKKCFPYLITAHGQWIEGEHNSNKELISLAERYVNHPESEISAEDNKFLRFKIDDLIKARIVRAFFDATIRSNGKINFNLNLGISRTEKNDTETKTVLLNTPLHIAVKKRSIETAKLLLSPEWNQALVNNGKHHFTINLNLVDEQGKTPLYIALELRDEGKPFVELFLFLKSNEQLIKTESHIKLQDCCYEEEGKTEGTVFWLINKGYKRIRKFFGEKQFFRSLERKDLNFYLHLAVKKRLLWAIELLLDSSLNRLLATKDSAIDINDYYKIDKSIDEPLSTSIPGKPEFSKKPALYFAVETGFSKGVETILFYGLETEEKINLRLFDDREHSGSLLLSALTNGHIDIAKQLLDFALKYSRELSLSHRLDINVHCPKHKTPLHYAVKAGDTDLVRLLLDDKLETALNCELDDKQPKNIIDLGAIDDESQTALHIALKNSDSKKAKEMANIILASKHFGQLTLEIQIKFINQQDINKKTTIHLAAKLDEIDILEQLLNYHETVSFKNQVSKLITVLEEFRIIDADGYRKFMKFISMSDDEIKDFLTREIIKTVLREFIETNEIDVNDRDRIETILEMFIKENKDLKSNLLESYKIRGVNINLQDQEGHTPLELAVYAHHFSHAELLLKRGASLYNALSLAILSLRDNNMNHVMHQNAKKIFKTILRETIDELIENNALKTDSMVTMENDEELNLVVLSVEHECQDELQILLEYQIQKKTDDLGIDVYKEFLNKLHNAENTIQKQTLFISWAFARLTIDRCEFNYKKLIEIFRTIISIVTRLENNLEINELIKFCVFQLLKKLTQSNIRFDISHDEDNGFCESIVGWVVDNNIDLGNDNSNALFNVLGDYSGPKFSGLFSAVKNLVELQSRLKIKLNSLEQAIQECTQNRNPKAYNYIHHIKRLGSEEVEIPLIQRVLAIQHSWWLNNEEEIDIFIPCDSVYFIDLVKKHHFPSDHFERIKEIGRKLKSTFFSLFLPNSTKDTKDELEKLLEWQLNYYESKFDSYDDKIELHNKIKILCEWCRDNHYLNNGDLLQKIVSLLKKLDKASEPIIEEKTLLSFILQHNDEMIKQLFRVDFINSVHFVLDMLDFIVKSVNKELFSLAISKLVDKPSTFENPAVKQKMLDDDFFQRFLEKIINSTILDSEKESALAKLFTYRAWEIYQKNNFFNLFEIARANQKNVSLLISAIVRYLNDLEGHFSIDQFDVSTKYSNHTLFDWINLSKFSSNLTKNLLNFCFKWIDSVPASIMNSLVTQNGDTLLHLAAEYDNIELIRKLVEKEASTNIRNNKGKLPHELTGDKNTKTIFNQHSDKPLHTNQTTLALPTKESALPLNPIYLPPEAVSWNKDNCIGRGRFGKVYRGEYNHQLVAIKKFKIDNITQRTKDSLEQEATLMQQLNSSYIIKFYGLYELKGYHLVMEYMEQGSLYKILHSSVSLSWEKRHQIATDIAQGLAYLHDKDIIHRDLKSPNVLLDANYHAKLADFGLAEIGNETKSKSTGSQHNLPSKESKSHGAVGTLRWMAPELLHDLRPKHNKASDMFAFAVVLWEIAKCMIPFPKADDSVIKDYLKTDNYTAELANEITELQKDKLADSESTQQLTIIFQLMQDCWAQIPSERKTAISAAEYLQNNARFFRAEKADSDTLSESSTDVIDETSLALENSRSIPS